MLEPIKDRWNIVLVGHWNISIFSPPWLTEFVFGEPELVFEFPITPGLPQRITGVGIRLIPKPDSVILSPSELSDKHLERMETFACNLLRNLPHTPISASGVNFGFNYEDDNADTIISEHFPSTDDTLFSDRDMALRDKTFIRSLDHDGWVLNLKTIIKDTKLQFNFNFHAATASAKISRDKIEGKVLELKSKAERILKDIYGL